MRLIKLQNISRIRWTTIGILVLYILSGGIATVYADSDPRTQTDLYRQNILYYDINDCEDNNNTGPAGTLPALIPEPYNGAFTKGGNTYKVAPALVAAIFTEENFTHTDPSQLAATWASFPARHPDPNSGWPTNGFHTEGAFQFLPGTWATEGEDGNGDGQKDPQNIWDAAAGAANYLASNGATTDQPPASWQKAIFTYNNAQWYVDAVMVYYQFYNSGNPSSTVAQSQPTTVSNCGSSSYTGDCSVTKPVYDAQYSQSQLAQIFGNPGTADSHPDLKLVSVNEWGFSTQVSPLVAPCLDATVKQLQQEGASYKVRLFGCYRFDSNNGSSNIGLSSYHTYGAACDINWDTNPFVESGANAPHDMPQSFIDAFNAHGFTWGGSWTSPKDFMHFEWHGVVPK